jgi:small ligand-binding sensory domain FIST
MDHFLLAHSQQTDWQLAIDECIEQLGALPPEASLGFIYVTDSHAGHLGEILRALRQESLLEHWVGTVGMAVCCTRKEYTEQPAIVMLISDIPESQFHLFTSPEDAAKLPPAMGVRVGIVHGDPRNGQMPNIIEQFPEQIGNGYLVGGLTSSNSYHYQIADEIVEGNLSGVILEDSVALITGLTQGCSPLGPVHVLSEIENNIAISIDQRPALDVMKEDIGEVLARDLNRIGGYIFAGFPVADSDTGDYLVRNLMGIDPDSGAIAVGEYLQTGSTIMFCKRDGKTAIEDLERMVTKLKTRAKNKIKGGLYFSCMGRGHHMFGEPNRELELIANIIGDVPLVGFYANGEIAGNRLYGYTGVLTLFLSR